MVVVSCLPLQFMSLFISVAFLSLSLPQWSFYLRLCCCLYVCSKQAEYNLGLVNVMTKNKCKWVTCLQPTGGLHWQGKEGKISSTEMRKKGFTNSSQILSDILWMSGGFLMPIVQDTVLENQVYVGTHLLLDVHVCVCVCEPQPSPWHHPCYPSWPCLTWNPIRFVQRT